MPRNLILIAIVVCWGLAVVSAPPAVAKSKKSPGAAAASSGRSMAELAGKFKWGMSPDDALKIIISSVHEKYAELIKAEQEVYRQDNLRKQEREEIEKIKASLVKFNGQKTGWESSIVEREFAHQGGEAMIVMWEKDQRRFLFFYNGKLYKQFIAFNAEHKAFAGKRFDDFVQIIQERYGQAEMKFSRLRTKDDMTVDHLEWPPHGDYQLFAIDHLNFYGNFCLRLTQPSVAAALDKKHEEKANSARVSSSALIDSVTRPDQISGDKNADIVDHIIGKKPQGAPSQGQ